MTGARGASNLLSILTTIVLARILMPSDFGLVALASTLLAIMTAVTNLSVGSALIHHRDPTAAHYDSAWTLAVARGALLTAALCAMAWPMAALYADPRLEDIIYVLSLNLLINGFSNPRLIKMEKELVFWQKFVLTVTNNVVVTIVSIVIAIVYESYWALVIGSVSGQAVSLVLSYVIFPYRPRFNFRHVRELLSFSIWLTFGNAIATVNYRIDHLLIGGLLGPATLGHYNVGENLATAAGREAIKPLTSTLFPAFAAVADSDSRLASAYQRAQATVTAIALPTCLGFALVAEPLVRLAMGEKWLPAVLVIQVIGSVYAFSTLGSLVGPLALATGNPRLLFVRSLQMLVLRMPFVVTGMYLAGLAGLLLARAFVGALSIVINLHLVRSLTGLKMRDQIRVNGRCLTASAVMAFAVLAIQTVLPSSTETLDLIIQILASVAVGVASYLATTTLLWVVKGKPDGPEREFAEVVQKFRRLVSR